METKGQALNLRGRIMSNQIEDKSPRFKISYLPLLRESPKTHTQSKKLIKGSPKALNKKFPKAKSQCFAPHHQQSNLLNNNSPTFTELATNQKFDVEGLSHKENGQDGKVFEEMPEIHIIKEETNIFRKRASCEGLQDKILRINQDFRLIENIDNQIELYDEKSQEEESPQTLKSYYMDSDLKKENGELKKKVADLEEEYTIDTNLLKKNIEKEKQKNNQLTFELDKSTIKYETLSRKYEGILENSNNREKSYKSEIEDLKNRLNILTEEMNYKNLEIAQINEYLQKKRKNSKIKENTLKDLHEKNQVLEAEHNLRNEELITVKTTLKRTQTELESQKNKFITVESYIQSLNNKSTDNISLEQALSEMKENYNFISKNYKELQKAYFNLKEKSYETEQNLLASIEKLKKSAQNNIGNFVNEPKIKKMKTFSSISNVEMASKDMVSRLLKKISTLEEEIVFYKNEIEKFNKDLVYHKKVIEEKSEMISIMNRKIENRDSL
ncbi:hypothetical protein SteCoe_17526 [Stentor coeruleus]|uniref:Uncharacterized protein n=1 Tax=Stentor coeruleus TaxID=5963 RepID=A0A1R2BZ59_9CILI|nr:hypothetical protein SteCoe_17526 [Stentor coeruleus]